jgi:hypothetical protein
MRGRVQRYAPDVPPLDPLEAFRRLTAYECGGGSALHTAALRGRSG